MWRENQMTDGIKWIYSHKYIVYRRPMAKLAHNAWHHDRDDVVCHLYLRWRVNEFRTSRRREFRRWIYRIYIANEVQIVLRWLAGVSPSLNHPKKRSDISIVRMARNKWAREKILFEPFFSSSTAKWDGVRVCEAQSPKSLWKCVEFH